MENRPVNQEEENDHILDSDIFLVEDETWKMSFDGASNQKGYTVDLLLLLSLQGVKISSTTKFDSEVTNDVVEYKAYIIGI